jgi:hypothetical protein
MLLPLPRVSVFLFLLLVSGGGCGPRPASLEALDQRLPLGVELNTTVETWDDSKQTVADELTRLHAFVDAAGTFHEGTGKPIKFFRRTRLKDVPAKDYQQVHEDEIRRLAELRKTHTVIITNRTYPGGVPPP